MSQSLGSELDNGRMLLGGSSDYAKAYQEGKGCLKGRIKVCNGSRNNDGSRFLYDDADNDTNNNKEDDESNTNHQRLHFQHPEWKWRWMPKRICPNLVEESVVYSTSWVL